MIPQIKIETLYNDLFPVNKTNKLNTVILSTDHQYEQNILSNTISCPTIELVLNQNNIQLKKLKVINDINLLNNLKQHLNDEFVKILIQTSEKHTHKINIDTKKETNKSITHKINEAKTQIIKNSLRGSPTFTISNQKTQKEILNIIDSSFFIIQNNDISIYSMIWKINEQIEDNTIIIGRKTQINQPGIQCFILTDEQGNIQFENYNYNEYLSMYYIITEAGVHPEYQYLKLNTRNIQYYRNKKLQKINQNY